MTSIRWCTTTACDTYTAKESHIDLEGLAKDAHVLTTDTEQEAKSRQREYLEMG
jgi:hypothetical protein